LGFGLYTVFVITFFSAAISHDGTTPLVLASQEGHIECAKQLLLSTDTVDVNAMNDDGDPALMCATRNGYADIVSLLFEHKVNY
jgi:ankyrin repeat protein